MKFSNIRLLVTDFDKCFAFYNETLGLECTWGKPGEVYASFNIGTPSGLALFKAELMDVAVNPTGTDNGATLSDKAVIVLEVEKVDEVFEGLKNKGIQFITEPLDMEAWGIRVAHFRDPENNLIEIFSPLATEG